LLSVLGKAEERLDNHFLVFFLASQITASSSIWFPYIKFYCSILGPALFLIFHNDLLETTANPVYSFDDDSTLYGRLSDGPLKTVRQQLAVSINVDLTMIDA
jgi:hypothetical protein